MNITDPLRRLARERPDAVALQRLHGDPSTYRTLDRRVDALAAWLIGQGVGPGDVAIVALGSPHREFYMRLALARLGATGAPRTLPPALAKLCLVPRGEPGPGHPRTVVVERERLDESLAPADPVPIHADGAAIASIFPAIAESGELRFVPVTHAGMAARIALADRAMPLTQDTRQMCSIPPTCAHGFLSMLRVLWAGGRGIAMSTQPDEFISSARAASATRFVLLPAALPSILALAKPGQRLVPSLEEVEISGGAVPAALLARARAAFGCVLRSVYRTTECGPIAALDLATRDPAPGEVGDAIEGVRIVVVGPDGRALPPGAEGRLRVAGEAVASGSFGGPASAQGRAGEGHVTNDVGTVGTRGDVRLAPRDDGVINAGGQRVHPRHLERALARIAWVADAAVFPVTDEHGLTRVGAAIVTRGRVVPDDIVTIGQRNDTCMPTVLMQVAQIPRTDDGEPRRGMLAEQALAQQRPVARPAH